MGSYLMWVIGSANEFDAKSIVIGFSIFEALLQMFGCTNRKKMIELKDNML